MIDSTNPRSMADNIRKLWEKFSKISGDLLPSRSTATTGQILKLTGENKTPAWADEYSYTPPAYSETETATGQKWIDGRDIYFKVITGNFPEVTASGAFIIAENLNINLIQVFGVVILDGFQVSIPYFNSTTTCGIRIRESDHTLQAYISSTTFSERPYRFTLFYTKPDSAPETREDDTTLEEPEEKKTTKKKTTKIN